MALFVRLVTVLLSATACLAVTSSLTYRFTARSFIQAGCARQSTDLDIAWNYTAVGGSSAYPSSGLFQGNLVKCPIWNDIASGKYIAHPDFEPLGTNNPYAEGCSGTNFDLTNHGGSSCKLSPSNNNIAALNRIVDNDMVFHEDGLPKPKYCTDNGRFPQDRRCGWLSSGTKVVTTSGPDNFASWYRDDPKRNLRAGFTLDLGPISGNRFQYSSSAFFPLAKNFGKGNFPCTAVGNVLSCANGGKAFPKSTKIPGVENDNQVWSFTSEHHSFFQLRGDETFTFSGDDDVWVYLNEKLAVDVGGLHPASAATINLANAYVRQQLGLEINGTYALDMYHAERHSSGSNFQITTGLSGGCTVLQSGKSAYAWDPATLSSAWKLIGGPTFGIVDGSNISLTDGAVQNTVGYAFLRQQVNVGGGFVITFRFSSTTNGEGFVFALQRDSIIDLNGGSGGNLGFKNTENSVGIVFDFCVDRDVNSANPTCDSREVRLHFRDGGGLNNAQSSATRKRRAPLYPPATVLNDGKFHTVTINYFGTTPPWLEVLVDNDLMLQHRNISLDSLIGGRNAFIGFTAATGVTASTIKITDVAVSTVGIEDSFTRTVNLPVEVANTPLFNATANGRNAISVDLQNFDGCGGLIQFGGFGSRAKGIMTLVERDNSSDATSSLVSNVVSSNDTLVLLAQIVDVDDGKYSLEFRTTVPGVYDLQVWYGVGCFVGGNNTGTVVTNPPSSTCYTFSKSRAAAFSPVPPPVIVPDSDPSQGLPQAAITGIAVAAGVIGFFGSILLVIGIRFRNQWRRDKEFIEAGRQAVAERDVTYLGDSDLDSLQQRLQQTLHAIQAERAKKLREGDKQAVIDELNRQRGELQEQVRRLKIKLDGGDPNEPIPTLGTRIRKSFAASRVSRGISMRLSRGFSLAAPIPENNSRVDPTGTELVSGNPLFQRISTAFGRKPPAHIDI